jgi:hypothetical protein
MDRTPHLLCAALASTALGLGACASGESQLEKFTRGINPVDGAAVLGVAWLASEYARPWDEQVLEQGAGRYRIEVARMAWSDVGEGDFGRRFKALGARACGGYRLLSYSERLEPAQFAGVRRIAEGVIECQLP